MRYQLMSINNLSSGKLMAIISFMIAIIVLVPFGLIASLATGKWMILFIALLVVGLNTVIGYVLGSIGASAFSIIADRIGGLEVEMKRTHTRLLKRKVEKQAL